MRHADAFVPMRTYNQRRFSGELFVQNTCTYTYTTLSCLAHAFMLITQQAITYKLGMID